MERGIIVSGAVDYGFETVLMPIRFPDNFFQSAL